MVGIKASGTAGTQFTATPTASATTRASGGGLLSGVTSPSSTFHLRTAFRCVALTCRRWDNATTRKQTRFVQAAASEGFLVLFCRVLSYDTPVTRNRG